MLNRGAAFTAVIAVLQLLFNVIKQHRENKVSRAKFGYELIDEMFSNESILWLVESLDKAPKPNVESFVADLKTALDLSVEGNSERISSMREAVDWLLFYFDRIGHCDIDSRWAFTTVH